MKKNKVKKIIIFLFIFLLILIIILLLLLKNAEPNTTNIIIPEVVNNPVTVKDAIEKYDSEYISREKNTIYVNFSKDLFDEEGNSNEEYFNSIAKELNPFVSDGITVIDEKKEIEIKVEDGNYIINGKEDYYETVDGEDYSKIDSITIVKGTNMFISSEELSEITLTGMRIKGKAKEKLGEQDENQLEENYTSYQNGKIKISKYDFSNQIRNMIFTRDYAKNIMEKIEKNDTLSEIYEKYPEPAFGSVRKGYLGYRTPDIYIFFYEDEISVYGYTYDKKEDLEDYMTEYLENRNLEQFANRMIVTYDNNYKYEFDEESQSLYLLYPSMGLEIDIKNNNPKGIKLYQNFYLTDNIRKFVKKGLITLEEDLDLIERTEQERRVK